MQESRSRRRMIGEFYIGQIKIKGEGDDQRLLIVIESSKTSHIYDIQVDTGFIKRDNALSLSFDNLQGLGRYLIKNFNDLRTTDDGNLIFEVKIGMKSHSAVLQGHKRDSGPLQLLNRRIENQINDAKQKLFVKSSEIQLNLTKTIVNQDSRIKALEEKIERQNLKSKFLIGAVVVIIMFCLMAGERILESYKFQKTLNQLVDLRFPSIEQAKEAAYQRQQDKRSSQYSGNLIEKKTPHSNSFLIKDNGIRCWIAYVAEDNIWRTFVKNEIIPKYTTTTYKVKQVQTQFRHILTGVATAAVSGKINAYAHQESIIYDSNDGEIWNSGKRKKIGRAVIDGETIKMDVNMIGWQIKWSIGNETLGVTTIPQHMRSKDLYFVIIMKYQDDLVELRYD